MNIRKAEEKDLEKILKMNEAAVPHVNSISLEDFKWFLDNARFFMVAEKEGSLAGFLIVLAPGLRYDSLNYKYFSEHFEAFDYVDRIVIGEQFRGKKLGSALYSYLFSHSEAPVITCEVNLKPANPVSLGFHKQLGFKEIDQQHTSGGNKRVSLMLRQL